MFIVAIKPCPQGQQPGQVFEVTDAAARVLLLVGAAREADPSELPTTHESPRRRYTRRDLRATV